MWITVETRASSIGSCGTGHAIATAGDFSGTSMRSLW
jgi:hypothetical protein